MIATAIESVTSALMIQLSGTAGERFQVRFEPMIHGKIEANLSTGRQMTSEANESVGAIVWPGVGYRRMYCCFHHGQSNREDGTQLGRASRGTDRRSHTEVNHLEKEVWQYWPHSLRLIACKQLGFRNLFFGSVANLHYSGAKGFLRMPMAG